MLQDNGPNVIQHSMKVSMEKVLDLEKFAMDCKNKTINIILFHVIYFNLISRKYTIKSRTAYITTEISTLALKT